MLRAMKFVFRAVNRKDWQDCTLDNLEEKLEVLKQIDSEEFRKLVFFDPEEIDYDEWEAKN